jgi:midasin
VNVAAGQFYDWEQHIAEEGFLLIAARVRHAQEAATVLAILQKVFKRSVDPENLFSLHEKTSTVTRPLLTSLLRQVFLLCS